MARNDRSPSQAPDCEYRPEGPTQGEHDTALRGFGSDGVREVHNHLKVARTGEGEGGGAGGRSH